MIALTGPRVCWDVPQLRGLNIRGGVDIIPELVAMALGMSIYGSAFVA
jgi:general L-amino acid transport system permease protein